MSKARLIYLFDSAGVDQSAEFRDVAITPEEADEAWLSYAAAREGGVYDWTFTATIRQEGPIWDLIVAQRGSTWKGYYSSAVDSLADTSATAKVYEFDAVVSIPTGEAFLGAETTTSASAEAVLTITWDLVDFDPLTAQLTAPPVIP